MNRTQANNSKRRSTRHLFDDDDDGPPAKRAKGDAPAKGASQGASGNARQVNGKTNGTARAKPKKGKCCRMISLVWTGMYQDIGIGAIRGHRHVLTNGTAYEEEDGDFAFSRARSKKDKSTPPTTDAANAPAPEQQREDAVEPPRKKPRKALPVTPEKDDIAVTRPRRSKRLSGEGEQATTNIDNDVQQAQGPEPRARKTGLLQTPRPKPSEEPMGSSPALGAAPAAQQLHVEKRRKSTKIDLLFSETPVIRRNKEMRKTGISTSRRSSSGMRGKRASSLIDSGTTNAVPHAEVGTAEFHKHISQDLTEPKRMRQLLVWCGKRALPEKPGANLTPAESQAMHAGMSKQDENEDHANAEPARVIQEELLNDFVNRASLSTWFDRPDTVPVTTVERPNPRNVANAAKLQELEAELAR